MSEALFDTANRLWFREGRTGRALAAYQEALRASPTDPVIAFQLARALWAFDRVDEARALLEQAHAHRDRLSPFGQQKLDDWRTQLANPRLDRLYPDLPPSSLDRDRLESGTGPRAGWRTIANAAAARGMHGLAVYAVDRWEGAPIDAEDANDVGDILSDRDLEETVLPSMYADRDGRAAPLRTHGPGTRRAPRVERPAPRPIGPVAAPVASPRPSPRVRPPALPALPLTLAVHVSPERGRVGVATKVTARLRNPTGETFIVNRRLLLNHIGSPGEIWLDVIGPPGYRNRRDFHIRVGRAQAGFFVPLGPGEAVEQSWQLGDYESLHVPGEYHVSLTYHNEDSRTPDGRSMPTGAVSGSAGFQRTG